MEYKYLSHFLGNDVPAYGNIKSSLNIIAVKSILKGDPANVYQLTMENHWGTHIDAPAHFFVNASSVVDYPPDYWIFKKPRIVDISLEDGDLIDVDMLQRYRIDPDADLLLIRTGFQRWRGKERYSLNNPGIKSDAGIWLRKSCPSMRAIGFDFISISSYANREEGRKAHKVFLNPGGEGKPILIIEDMNLQVDLKNLKEVWVFPLLIKGIDSAPCTVIGVFE